MAYTVSWRLMYRVADRKALDRCLERTLPLINSGYLLGECKPYWKVPELWEVALSTAPRAESVAEEVLCCLLIAYRVATGWYILGSLSTESADGFEGIFALGENGARSNVVGLEWASFVVRSEQKAEETREGEEKR